MAMANGVEGRYPMLDHRVFEFAAALPSRMKMRGLKEKWLLKRAVGSLVPESIVRRPKQPYRAPDATSFVDEGPDGRRFKEFVVETLSEKRLRDTGLFDPGTVGVLCDKVLLARARGVKDNMAFVGILSTQILAEQLLGDPLPSEQLSSAQFPSGQFPSGQLLGVPAADAETPAPLVPEIIQGQFGPTPVESVE